MIDVLEDIILEVLSFIFRIVFEIIMVWTGEIILYIITLGKRRPRWDLYNKDTFPRFAVFTEISCWIGITFWIAAIYLVYLLGLL